MPCPVPTPLASMTASCLSITSLLSIMHMIEPVLCPEKLASALRSQVQHSLLPALSRLPINTSGSATGPESRPSHTGVDHRDRPRRACGILRQDVRTTIGYATSCQEAQRCASVSVQCGRGYVSWYPPPGQVGAALEELPLAEMKKTQ